MRSIEAMKFDDDMDQYVKDPHRKWDADHCLAFEWFLLVMLRLAHQTLSARIIGDSTNETSAPMAQRNHIHIRIQLVPFPV